MARQVSRASDDEKRTVAFNMRMTESESEMLKALSAHEERSDSDTMRRMVVKAFKAAGLQLPKKSPKRS